MDLPNFIGGSYPANTKDANLQRTINWIPIPTGTQNAEGKTPIMLIDAPGLDLFSIIGASGIRGIHAVENVLYAVVGQAVYSVLANGVSTQVGTLVTTTGRVYMEHNANSELAIVDGRFLYIFNYDTLNFSIPSPQPVGQPTSIAFMDQYFIVSLANSGQFQLSDPNAGTIWDPLQVATAESSPDNLKRVAVIHRQLYLFGTSTTEIWYDAGTSPFPFQTTSGVIDWGVQAPESVALASDRIVWLGRHRTGSIGGRVMVAAGLEAKPISTPALEYRWRQYPTVEDAYGFSYQMDGSDFYVITFPAGGETFVYDFTTNLWHERSSYFDLPWLAYDSARVANKQLVSDRTMGNIYLMGTEIKHEGNTPIVRRRISPHYWNDRKRVVVNSLQVEFEMGVLS